MYCEVPPNDLMEYVWPLTVAIGRPVITVVAVDVVIGTLAVPINVGSAQAKTL